MTQAMNTPKERSLQNGFRPRAGPMTSFPVMAPPANPSPMQQKKASFAYIKSIINLMEAIVNA